MKIRALAALAALVPAFALAACASSDTAPAGTDGADAGTGAASGTITLYTSEPQEKIDEIIAAYNEFNPDVTVEVFRAGTGELKTRVQTEKETGGIQADVILAADVPTFEKYADAGDLLELDVPEAANLDPKFVDPEGFWVGTRVIPTVIAYNTNAFDAQTAPTSWHDLTKPEYSGQIAMPNPDVSGAAAFNAAVWLDEPKLGEEWLTALMANEPTILESNGPVGNAVAEGTANIGIVVDYVIRDRAAQGSPVTVVYPSEGAPYVSQPAGVFAASENPEAANEFVNFLVSQQGQQLAVSQAYVPVRDDAGAPEGAPALSEITLLDPDLARIAEIQPDAVAKFKELAGL